MATLARHQRHFRRVNLNVPSFAVGSVQVTMGSVDRAEYMVRLRAYACSIPLTSHPELMPPC